LLVCAAILGRKQLRVLAGALVLPDVWMNLCLLYRESWGVICALKNGHPEFDFGWALPKMP